MNPVWRKRAIAAVLILFGTSVLFLSQQQFGDVIETDVSTLLPSEESSGSRIARSFVSDKQGRGTYLLVDCSTLTDNAREETALAMEEMLGASPLVSAIAPIDESLFVDLFSYVSQNRLHLLLPKWIANGQRLYSGLENPNLSFEEWAANHAVEQFDAFLESPEAMQMSEEALIDPLLLNISALNTFSSTVSSNDSNEQSHSLKYWITLSSSPLVVATQESFEALIVETENRLSKQIVPGIQIQYGGLLKLAAASRERIQSDVFKLNLLSLVGVALIAGVFVQRPWNLLKIFPIIIFALVGSLATSVAIFGSIHIIVLVIGSIIIGISIDYAFHAVFQSQNSSSTRKLLLFACLSTVAGALTFLTSSLPLIRQIGAFTASGLFFAFIYSLVLKRDEANTAKRSFSVSARSQAGAKILLLLSVPFSLYGLFHLSWADDIKNMEAADPAAIREDMALRKQFVDANTSETLLVTGDSYLQVFDRSARFLDALSEGNSFALSHVLSSLSDVESTHSGSFHAVRFFELLQQQFAQAGYDPEAFASFFDDAKLFAQSMPPLSEFERQTAGVAQHLKGPFTGLLDSDHDLYWTIIRIPKSVAPEVPEHIARLSKLEFINDSLNHYRNSLSRFGLLSISIVAALILIFFGLRKGSTIILIPGLSVLFSLGVASVVFENLNIFHVAGCFLAMALSLDYALFAFDSFARRQPIPFSVWLSAATTATSFLALNASAIPVVRSLGFVVCINTAITLVLLVAISSRYKTTDA